MKAGNSGKILTLLLSILVIVIVIIIVNALLPNPTILTGMVEATEIDVSSKIPGRIDSVVVSRGDHVVKGQLLFTIQSREVDAKVEQARALRDAAQAKYDMARNGARPEEREGAEKLFNQAQAQFDLAEKTWNRVHALFTDSVVSTQEKDQIEFQYKAAREQRDAAKARYEMVKSGARSEEIRGAEALFRQAENGFAEALSYQSETHIYSPLEGEISKLIVDPGEMVASGYPIVTVTKSPDQWIVLQVREDLMKKFSMGASIDADIPALSLSAVPLKVAYIAPMADFATWRATNQKGDFDLKTFEIQLRPALPIAGLRAGMTARVKL